MLPRIQFQFFNQTFFIYTFLKIAPFLVKKDFRLKVEPKKSFLEMIQTEHGLLACHLKEPGRPFYKFKAFISV